MRIRATMSSFSMSIVEFQTDKQLFINERMKLALDIKTDVIPSEMNKLWKEEQLFLLKKKLLERYLQGLPITQEKYRTYLKDGILADFHSEFELFMDENGVIHRQVTFLELPVIVPCVSL